MLAFLMNKGDITMADEMTVEYEKENEKFVVTFWGQPKYEFLVKRKKDKKTGLEVMEIRAQDAENNHEFLGTIYSRYLNIRTNIIEFQNYGVVLDRLELWKVADAIKDNYGNITTHQTQYINNYISEDIVKDFFDMLCQCIKDDEKIKRDGDFYNIEPENLRAWYNDSSFRMFSLTELKEELAALGYMKTNKNRNDNTIKKDGVSKKVYSLWGTKVEEVLKKKEEE